MLGWPQKTDSVNRKGYLASCDKIAHRSAAMGTTNNNSPGVPESNCCRSGGKECNAAVA